jgi:hypothetical protein
MAKINIVVNVRPTIPKQPAFKFPSKPKPGMEIPFTEDVVLTEYGTATAGNGLPQKEASRFAGIHSGFLTLLRITGKGDRFYKPDVFVYQYVATYRFNDLAGTPLTRSQITAIGLSFFDTTTHTGLKQEMPTTYAITGGTGAFANALGQIVERGNQTDDRELYIEV